ncbi:hypothetical protein ACLOJK_037061 [Asimina triloba]
MAIGNVMDVKNPFLNFITMGLFIDGHPAVDFIKAMGSELVGRWQQMGSLGDDEQVAGGSQANQQPAAGGSWAEQASQRRATDGRRWPAAGCRRAGERARRHGRQLQAGRLRAGERADSGPGRGSWATNVMGLPETVCQ